MCKMKFGITILFALAVTAIAGAATLDTADRAIALRDQIENAFLRMDGVSGMGVGGVDPRTGAEAAMGADSVHCLLIYASTSAAKAHLLSLYPVGTKISGIFVRIVFAGEVKAQPRLSVGTTNGECESQLIPPGL